MASSLATDINKKKKKGYFQNWSPKHSQSKPISEVIGCSQFPFGFIITIIKYHVSREKKLINIPCPNDKKTVKSELLKTRHEVDKFHKNY